MAKGNSNYLITFLSVILCLFTIVFVNYPVLQPQSSLALFVLMGMVFTFLTKPAIKSTLPSTDDAETGHAWFNYIDRYSMWLMAILSIVVFGYIFVQTEPVFESLWPDDAPFTNPTSLGNRAGDETNIDYVIALIGFVLVLEATRRTIGLIVPVLAIVFVLHAYFAASLPDWLLPHPGMDIKEIVSKTVLQDSGVLGPAASVMFRFVFLFVVFGAFLEMSGATQFIIDFSQRLFGGSAGGPAKVSVLGSGLMGSLSGSAVANAVTTGSFTIPMMRSAGFQPHVAGGITAAAATGGALVPPVMGAGAYMMLEFVVRPEREVTFLEVAKSALIPAVLYYFSLFMIVHFFAKKESQNASSITQNENDQPQSIFALLTSFESAVFFGALGFLVALLLMSFSPFKAVTGALVVILVLAIFRKELDVGFTPRILAALIFVAAVVVHQFSGRLTTTEFFENNILKSFLSTPWTNPTTDQIGVRQTFESILNSSFFGMLGLMIFGLIHYSWRNNFLTAFQSSARNGVALITASACVGIIIGIVDTTPIAKDFSAVIASVVESNLLLALFGIMSVSLLLGMGVPSVVCYLLVATLMGDLLNDLGVDPLAAHMFIFYYGMMSMVTPPVALAAYASASIAQAPIMKTAFASFRFSLVGFTLPFMFIYRPALLLMGENGENVDWMDVGLACVFSFLGVIALAAAVTGYFRNNLSVLARIILFAAALLLLAPNVGGPTIGLGVNLVGAILLGIVAATNKPRQEPQTSLET